jgi:hypothetical protein
MIIFLENTEQDLFALFLIIIDIFPLLEDIMKHVVGHGNFPIPPIINEKITYSSIF